MVTGRVDKGTSEGRGCCHSPVSQSSVGAVTLALSYAGTLVSPFMWPVSLPQLCAGTCQMSMSVHCHAHGDVTSLI